MLAGQLFAVVWGFQEYKYDALDFVAVFHTFAD